MEIVEKEEKKHPTVLRTFRLSAALDRALTKKAERKGLGKNALIASILTKYDEWDSVVEDLGYLSIPYEMLAKLMEGLDKDSIFMIAKIVSKNVASSLPIWFGSSDLDGVLKYMETSVKYSGARVQQRIEKDGNVTRVIAYQPFSENGAAWVRGFNTGLIENALGYPPKIIEHANSIETVIESK